MNASVEIYAPDLVRELEHGLARHDMRARSLVTMLARADYEPCRERDFVAAVLAACGCEYAGAGTAPLAAALAAYDLDDTPSADVMCSEPVYLRADAARVVLFDAASIGLSATESDALLALLNPAFADQGLRFRRGRSPLRWYVEGVALPHFESAAPRTLHGTALEPNMTQMRGLGPLNTVMTEIQMLLHECPVNQARVEAGKPPVNSIWFWGAGSLTAPDNPSAQHLICADDIAAACAGYFAIDYHRNAHTLAGIVSRATGPVAILCPPDSAEGRLKPFMDEIFQPALVGLRERRVADISVITGPSRFVLSRAALRRFWRRSQPFFARFVSRTRGAAET
jgi:hypothetical protein